MVSADKIRATFCYLNSTLEFVLCIVFGMSKVGEHKCKVCGSSKSTHPNVVQHTIPSHVHEDSYCDVDIAKK